MKYFIIALSLSIQGCSSSIKTIDSVQFLSKYSYIVLGFETTKEGKIPYNGTCFFINRNDKLYLITAKHVITGCENGQKTFNTADVLNVLIKDSLGKVINVINAGTSQLKAQYPCKPSYEDLDAIAIEVSRPENATIYTVENYIRPRFLQWDKIEIFGFPREKTYKDSSIGHEIVSHRSINPTETKFEYQIDSSGREDTLHYVLLGKYLTEDLTHDHGYSGSPVFIRNTITKEWRIVGLYVAFSKTIATNQPGLTIAKIEYLKY